MMPLLFRRSGGGASSATEAGAAVATAVLLSATPALGPLPPVLPLLLPPLSWGLLPRLDMVGPRPRAHCWGRGGRAADSGEVHRRALRGCPRQRCLVGPAAQGRHMVRCPPGRVFTRLSGVLRAATAAAAARPRGRGGAGSCAPLRAPPPRCAPLQPRRLLARVRSRSHAAAAGPRRGGGGARSTCPSSPSPRPKLKNNKKQLITPERSAARRAESAA